MDSSKIRVIYNNESTIVETIEQAQRIADAHQLDLVEVAPNIYKVMNYSKYQYNQQKQIKHNKQTNKQGSKEAQFNIGIADNDMQRKIRDISKWLNNGIQVRVLVKLRGREQNRPEISEGFMQRIIDGVTQTGVHIVKPTIKIPDSGRDIIAILKPIK